MYISVPSLLLSLNPGFFQHLVERNQNRRLSNIGSEKHASRQRTPILICHERQRILSD